MFRDAALVAGKDLRIEWRSRAGLGVVLPFALLMLLLFGFAFDPDSRLLAQASAGLFWLAMLFVTMMLTQRSAVVEFGGGTSEGLRLAGIDPAGVFLGKTFATTVQLLLIEVLLGVAVVATYGRSVGGLGLVAVVCALAAIGLAAASTLYGVLSAGSRARETVLPILLLPVLAPLLIAATQALDSALDDRLAESGRWVGLLAVFALVELGLGLAAYGSLLEDT